MSFQFAKLATVWLILVASSLATAAEKSATQLLPASTAFFAEIPRPRHTLQAILEHPLRERLEILDEYQQAFRGEEYKQLQAVVKMVETQLGMAWQDVIGTLTEGGVHAAFDVKTQGIALLVKASNQDMLRKVRDVFLTFVRGVAQGARQRDPIEADEYRGIEVFEFQGAKFATFGPWLVVTDKGQLGKTIIDRYLDGGGDTLANNQRWQQARRKSNNRHVAWAFADIQAVRDAGIAADLFQGQTDNPLAELIFGGLLGNLQQTPFLTAALELQSDYVSFALSSPHDPKWIGQPRAYYFGPDGQGEAPKLLRPNDTLLTLSTYRDIGGMWLHAGDLFDEGVNDELAKAESGLSTLFAGKDFGEEILAAFEPQIQVVVTRQDFADTLPQPAIKLPAFAAVLRLSNADEMRDELRRTFQSLVGFLNIVGAMQGQPQLDFEIEKQEGKQFVTTSYVAEGDEKQSRQARINFNFSPSIAVDQERFVLSSTANLVRELSHPPAKNDADDDHVNSQVYLDAKVLRDILDDNRNQLIAQNMLEDGNSKEEAERYIDNLLKVIGWFRDATANLGMADGQLQLQVRVNFDKQQ